MSDTNISNPWDALSAAFAAAVDKAASSVVAVHARRRIPSSGVHWRPGIIVTADHTLQRDEEIAITLPEGKSVAASVAGRDAGTDLAVLKVENLNLPVATVAETSALHTGHLLLSVGRTAEGGSRSALALVSVAGPAWKTWTGGRIDQTIRLDRNLHPNLSGGAVVDDQGRVLGVATAGLSRFATTVIPASTVNRVSLELEKKGHIGRGYIGVSLQPVQLPQNLRESLKLSNDVGLMIMGIETASPAEKAGLALGDTIVGLDGKPIEGLHNLQENLSGENIGKIIKASVVRGNALTDFAITVAERPAPSAESGWPGRRGRWAHGWGRGGGGWRRPN